MSKLLDFFLIFLLFVSRLFFLPKLNLKDGQLVKVIGTLSEEPQIFGKRQRIKLGQIEIWTDRYPEYHYGDKIEAVGRVKVKSATLRLRSGQEFKVQNFPKHPLFSFISPLISPKTFLLAEVEIKTSDLNDLSNLISEIKKIAIELRRRLKANFSQYFPSPLDGLVAGIVLGDKSLIPQDFWQKLQQTGTLHIMVASGMNIAMFSNGILSFFTYFFKRRLAILFVILTIWFYCFIAGMQPPILRAGIMASLMYLSQLMGREAERGRVLFITAGLMLFASPFLLWDVGFQLSFMATAGLVYVGPRVKSLISHMGHMRHIGKTARFVGESEDFVTSVSSLIMTLPILVTAFGQLNILSPVINLVILWTIPTILQMGMVIGLAGIGWIKLGEVASYFLFPLLFYLKQAINLFAKISLFQIQVPMLGWWWGVGYYLLLWRWIRDSR